MTKNPLSPGNVNRATGDIENNLRASLIQLERARKFKTGQKQGRLLDSVETIIRGALIMSNRLNEAASTIITETLDNIRQQQAERDAAADPLMQLVMAAEKDGELAAQIYN